MCTWSIQAHTNCVCDQFNCCVINPFSPKILWKIDFYKNELFWNFIQFSSKPRFFLRTLPTWIQSRRFNPLNPPCHCQLVAELKGLNRSIHKLGIFNRSHTQSLQYSTLTSKFNLSHHKLKFYFCGAITNYTIISEFYHIHFIMY